MSADPYYLEIEGHFAARRGTPFILSSKDWALMKKWHDDGVPLPIVIEAIDSVFEKNETSGRRKVISSLAYCRHAVKELWDERRNLYVGETGETPESAPAAVLEELAKRLETSPAGSEFASRVRALVSERSVPRIEQRLIELEGEMLQSMVSSAPNEIAAMRQEIADALGDASSLDEKTRARTEEANLRRLIRERFDLPRLTLFG
jgi:hypothetical protein